MIATLKKAITDYLLIDDVHNYDYEHSIEYYTIILGRLEISLTMRKRDLEEDRNALLKLEKE